MKPRRYLHAGRTVEAMRFLGNGLEVARFAEPYGLAVGDGLIGFLRVGGQAVECGDWVVRDGACVSVVPQEVFAHRFKEVRHADVH